MKRILFFLFATTGILGVSLLLLSVPVCYETGMNIGLISILSSALLLLAVVLLGSINCRCQKRSFGKPLSH